MMEDRFDDVLSEAARSYNEPPEPPRELMWARIEAIRRERAERRRQLRILYSPWTRWGIGIAAALIVGIGIGRYAMRSPTAPVANGGEAPVVADASVAYRLITAEHLARAEAFLTGFRTDRRLGEGAGTSDAELGSATEDLLSSTRLLLDSPAADDPGFRTLLEDLELVLVQIARLTAEDDGEEVELVTDGIEHRGLLLRLRTAIPAGPVVGMEGAQ